MTERRRDYAKSLDGKLPTPEQMKKLGKVATSAFVEIRNRSSDARFVFAIADAFHNLPVMIHSSQFSWSWFLMDLETLEREFPEVGRRYIAEFDDIVEFRT